MSGTQTKILIILSTIAACVFCAFFMTLFVILNRNVEPEAATIINQTDTSSQVSSPTSIPPTVVLPEAPEPTATSTRVVPATPYDGPTNAYQPVATNSPVDATAIPDPLSGPLPRLTETSPWGDGGYGMFYDVSPTISRQTLLAFGYEVARKVMYSDDPPTYVTIHLHFEDHFPCNMGLGIGISSREKYLPATRPANLENWFVQLVQSHYYGDEPGQRISLIAYGNDAANKPLCDLSHLK